jgi:hypothetical protein
MCLRLWIVALEGLNSEGGSKDLSRQASMKHPNLTICYLLKYLSRQYCIRLTIIGSEEDKLNKQIFCYV